jgi:hypothetical protein
MKINIKKSLKFVTLLVASLLIATVSAGTYSELFMHATPISIGSAGVKFTNGLNTTSISTGGINTAGTEVTFDNILAIEPGETRIYEQAVNITNNSGSTKTVNMSLYSLTGQFSNNFDYIYITLLDESGTQKGDRIEILPSGDNVTETTGQSMANNAVWTVKWEIKAKLTATNGQSISVTLKVKVE